MPLDDGTLKHGLEGTALCGMLEGRKASHDWS